MSGLFVRGLTVAITDRLLLDHVSLEVRAGEVVALIGPNGAGKTTCLKAILGLVPARGERIEVAGRPLAALAPGERARAIAYLPQARHVAWPLSVASTVALGRHPHAREGEAAEHTRAARTLETVGLKGFAARDVRTLSGGELALALLARALLVEAPILLADEPVASLDLAHQLVVMGELRRTARTGAGVLVVMHDLSLAARCCDRLLLLDRGRLVAAGLPDAVLADRAAEEAYGVGLVRGNVEGVPVVVARAGISSASAA
jgi:iron complex transport system ATP-binding protein